MSKIKTIPKSAMDVVEHYCSLRLGDKKVTAPYFINLGKTKDLRAMIGKGTPEEMELEAKMWEKLKGVDFNKMSEKQIREFLIERGIGIDCSGFVVHVLNNWFKESKGFSIFKKLKPQGNSLRRKISYFLRPVENLGAEVLTNEVNSKKIEIKDVKPGDLIRSKWKRNNSHHILLVYEVERTEGNKVKKIKYVYSTEQYGENNGIRFGVIEIADEDKPLEEQRWIDNDEHGVNHVFEGYQVKVEDNGLRRLNFMD